jgi:hypothetical protein
LDEPIVRQSSITPMEMGSISPPHTRGKLGFMQKNENDDGGDRSNYRLTPAKQRPMDVSCCSLLNWEAQSIGSLRGWHRDVIAAACNQGD